MTKTQRASVTLARDTLARAKKSAAARGLSLSGFLMKLVTDHLEREGRFEQMGQFVEAFAPNVRVTMKAMERVRAEMNAPPKPIRRRGRKRAA